MNRRWAWALAAVLLLAAAALAVVGLNLRGETPLQPDTPAALRLAAQPDQIARGAYLARAGNCAACHTARGGAPYAGGRAIATPFGTVFSSNLTPDAATGLGAWTGDEFWRALHHGRTRDGRLLVPAFPYPNTTLVTRADADALHAYLRSLPPVAQANRAHDLRWPYRSQAALAIWRALYFRPGEFQPDTRQSAEWNRGAYLVNGLGHCSACHARRNLLGAAAGLGEARGGSALPQQRWVAPSLADPTEAGVGADAASIDSLVQLLKTGINEHAVALGPMAEVVAGSTQHLAIADLRAMAGYLATLGATAATAGPAEPPPPASRAPAAMARGGQLYNKHCADCHGDQGQGAPGIYPPLAGNRTVTMANPQNMLQAITSGGFPPATAGNPRPYGMPAFDLPPDDLAALTTWLRGSWGHQAAPVSAVQALLSR